MAKGWKKPAACNCQSIKAMIYNGNGGVICMLHPSMFPSVSTLGESG